MYRDPLKGLMRFVFIVNCPQLLQSNDTTFMQDAVNVVAELLRQPQHLEIKEFRFLGTLYFVLR